MKHIFLAGLICSVSCAGSIAMAQGLSIALLDNGQETCKVQPLLGHLQAAGYSVSVLTCDDLAQSGCLTGSDFNVLILPDSPVFPAPVTDELYGFLKQGKHLVMLNGQSFTEPLERFDNRWVTKKQYQKFISATPPTWEIADFTGDPEGWQHSTNKSSPQSALNVDEGPTAATKSLKFNLRQMGPWQWDVYVLSLTEPFPTGQNAVCLWAKAGPRTNQVVIEVNEKDNARWAYTLDLTDKWQRYVIPADSFKYIADAAPETRGGAGDCLRLDNARRISFGLATGLSQHSDGDHLFWISDVGGAKIAITTPPEFKQKPDLDILPDYEPYYLKAAVNAEVWSQQDIITSDEKFPGQLAGLSAIAYSLPNISDYLPLLVAQDSYGRERGWALGTLVNYDGQYKGGCWLLSGINSLDFYKSDVLLNSITNWLKALETRNLPAEAQARNDASRAMDLSLKTPAPHGFITRSADGRHFLTPDGKPLYLLGCNYANSYDRQFHWGWAFDAGRIENDFRQAREAGYNCFRLWSGTLGGLKEVEAIRELARRYGIYLIIHAAPGGLDMDRILFNLRTIVEAWKDEPMVIGFDLVNEPYVESIGGLQYQGEKSLLIKLQPFTRYADQINQDQAEEWAQNPPGWPPMRNDISVEDKRELYAAWQIYNKWVTKETNYGADYSTLTGATGQLPLDGKFADFAVAANETFNQWIKAQVDVIREVDPNHFISVGYNTVLELLPANSQLDFTNHHIYQMPSSLENAVKNTTTLDRIAEVWPNRPMTLGEFGYSNGMEINGKTLDWDTSAVGEMAIWLHALAMGHSGALKWGLAEWPKAIMKHNAPWMNLDNLYEQRFGSFTYNGTLKMLPKPVVYATRFLRQYIDRAGPGGEIEHRESANPIGAGYVFRGQQALFVGDVVCELPELKFNISDERPANVMLDWGVGDLRLMSTRDLRVSIKLEALDKNIVGNASGSFASVSNEAGWLNINLLAGEEVNVK